MCVKAKVIFGVHVLLFLRLLNCLVKSSCIENMLLFCRFMLACLISIPPVCVFVAPCIHLM